MARYIDADKLKDDFCESCSTHKRYHLTVEQCRAKEKENPDSKWCFKMRMIDKQPTADVEEVKHGEWIEHFAFDCWHYDCPFCDDGFATKERDNMLPNYCGNCGGNMDGGKAE